MLLNCYGSDHICMGRIRLFEILKNHPVVRSRAGRFKDPDMEMVVSTRINGQPAEIRITPHPSLLRSPCTIHIKTAPESGTT